MLLALDREPLVEVRLVSEVVDHLAPDCASLARTGEGTSVSDDDHGVASAGQEYVQSFRGVHEPDTVLWIAPGKRNDDDVVFLSLVVV